jgi:mRNA-degrading endonuclease HigB of HigAB toxin-antitoxin module
LGFQENIDNGAMDEHPENMQIEHVITKDEVINPEATKEIPEQAIMDETENMQIEEVITKAEHTHPESKKAGFLFTCHNSDRTEQYVIFTIIISHQGVFLTLLYNI